jgi:hypothetical protein
MIAVEAKQRKEGRIPKVIRIEAVRYIGPYKLLIRFSDRHEGLVDFGCFLKASAHPSIRAYLDVERFKAFTVEDGFLQWNDFDLVFPIVELYKGQIS